MNVKLLSMARKLWDNRRYQRQWARSVHQLGDKWLLAKYVEKKTPLQ